MKFVWLVILCVFISGCATYRPVSFPAVEQVAGSGEGAASSVEGATVRIALHSGREISGKVLWFRNESLAVDRGGNYDNEVLVIGILDIDHAEIREESDGTIEKRWFLTLGAAALVSAYFGLRNMGL